MALNAASYVRTAPGAAAGENAQRAISRTLDENAERECVKAETGLRDYEADNGAAIGWAASDVKVSHPD